MVIAVIGIGSNSVRMLTAEINGARGTRIRRDREGTRLFAGLGAGGVLDAAAMDKTVASVTRLAAQAREMGAQEVLLFATSATRDAANKEEFAQRLREEAQVELTVCSGEEEAALSFIGATGGGRCGVIDIGGGSTEVVVGEESALECAFSCQMGAVRLFRELPIASVEDLAVVEARATALLDEKLAQTTGLRLPERWYGTGGTFTTLASMVNGVHWTDRTLTHGTVLTLDAVERLVALMAGMTPQERLSIPGLQPNRADIVVHGVCILIACMRRMGLTEITVSENGNLDGYVKRHYGLTEGLY